MLPELTKPRTPDPEAPVWRAKSYGVGASRFIAGSPEPLTTNLILTRNLGLGEAQRETQQIVDWLATLGTTSFEMDHRAEYHEARLTWAMPTGLRKGGAK